MPSYFIYHPQSGTVVSKLKVHDASMLEYQDNPGYTFFETTDESDSKSWIDPTTSEVFGLIEHKFDPSRIYVTVGEEVTVPLIKPCWIAVDFSLPFEVTTGEYKISSSEAKFSTVKIVGRYDCAPIAIYWTSLDDARTRALTTVDEQAEAARALLQTPGAGQATTYLRKADSARMHLAGVPVSSAQLSRLQDEANRLGVSLDAAAASIIEVADAWEERDADIDRIRLDAKAAINAAATGTEINTILNQIVWPS